MNTSEIFCLQNQAASQNILLFPEWFHWCDLAIELMVDAHVYLANDEGILAYREDVRLKDSAAFDVDYRCSNGFLQRMSYTTMPYKTVIRLLVVARNPTNGFPARLLGSLISAIRLVQFGVLADAWSLVRGAFESSCYAEYFRDAGEKIKDYLVIAEKLRSDRSADIRQEITQGNLQIGRVLHFLQGQDGQNLEDFYGRLSNFGTHASPVRSGLRIRINEPDVRVYLSIAHRELVQCLADLAATAKYAMGIPFETWPELMVRNAPLVTRHIELESEYRRIFES